VLRRYGSTNASAFSPGSSRYIRLEQRTCWSSPIGAMSGHFVLSRSCAGVLLPALLPEYRAILVAASLVNTCLGPCTSHHMDLMQTLPVLEARLPPLPVLNCCNHGAPLRPKWLAGTQLYNFPRRQRSAKSRCRPAVTFFHAINKAICLIRHGFQNCCDHARRTPVCVGGSIRASHHPRTNAWYGA
jgi:hypothetical protein